MVTLPALTLRDRGDIDHRPFLAEKGLPILDTLRDRAASDPLLHHVRLLFWHAGDEGRLGERDRADVLEDYEIDRRPRVALVLLLGNREYTTEFRVNLVRPHLRERLQTLRGATVEWVRGDHHWRGFHDGDGNHVFLA